ncbi:MAG TPA: hypothetical protein VF981_13420 [Gemmatimonadaceae bacterium]
MRTRARSLLALGALASVAWTAAPSDVRIETRVDPRIRSAVGAIWDSLVSEGLFPEPLVQYALEGTQKRGRPDVILAGVRRWATDLRRARTLLGPNATPMEVNAGAKALRAGAKEDELVRFRDATIERRYASALNTIAYLIKLGVPSDTASRLLVNLAMSGASELQLRLMQDDVERDIGGGMPAGLAAFTRAVGVVQAIEAGVPDGVTPGATLPSTRGTARPADPMANGNLRGSAVGSKGEIVRPPAPRGKDSKRP